jgi:hypothetical protein
MAQAYEKELLQSEGYAEADDRHKQLLGYLRSVDDWWLCWSAAQSCWL